MKKSLFILIALLVTFAFCLTACQEQAKSTGKEAKPACHAKVADANAAKPCPMAAKKPCAAPCKKPCSATCKKPCSEKMKCALCGRKLDNKNVSWEYKGKTYYFCCEGCKKQFEIEPDKYVSRCRIHDANAVPKK